MSVEENKVKPFCIECSVLDLNSLAILMGKLNSLGVNIVEDIEYAEEFGLGNYSYFGVNDENDTIFYNYIESYGESSEILPPLLILPEVDEHLVLTKPVEIINNQTIPLNCKLDCRKEDGSGKVDTAKSEAFQKACFESGIEWRLNGDVVHHYHPPFLYVEGGVLNWGHDTVNFSEDTSPEIKFNYDYKLTYEVEIMETVEKRKIVVVGGVEYYEKEFDEAMAALQGAKVSITPLDGAGMITTLASGWTPPERPKPVK